MFIINSFESYELRRIGANDDTDNHVNELTDCMRLALPLTTEKRIFLEEEFKNAMKSSLHDPLLCQFESAFNDMRYWLFSTVTFVNALFLFYIVLCRFVRWKTP